MKTKKNMKWYKFIKTDIYKTADVVEMFDSKGYEVPDHEDINDAKVLKIEARGGWLTVTIERPKITYKDITVSKDRYGNYVCSCRLNGYLYEEVYIFFSKKEALKKFHEEVNKLVR